MRADVSAGSRLVLVTDGVTERTGPSGDFGLEGVKKSIASVGQRSARLLMERIVQDTQEHARNAAATDDLTVVVIENFSRQRNLTRLIAFIQGDP